MYSSLIPWNGEVGIVLKPSNVPKFRDMDKNEEKLTESFRGN